MLKPRIQEIVDQAVDSLLAQPATPVDLVEHFAQPVPALVLEQLIGIPAADLLTVQKPTETLLRRSRTKDEQDEAAANLHGHLNEAITAKEDELGDDLLSRQIIRSREEKGEVDRSELASLIQCHLFGVDVVDLDVWRLRGDTGRPGRRTTTGRPPTTDEPSTTASASAGDRGTDRRTRTRRPGIVPRTLPRTRPLAKTRTRMQPISTGVGDRTVTRIGITMHLLGIRLIREYLPKGTDIVQHQPYLTAITEELNTRPRACLGFYTPQEVFHQMLLDGQSTNGEGVASTN